MKIRVIYNEDEIISVDKPDGAAALNYDQLSMVIENHEVLLPFFYERGFDVSKLSNFLIQEGILIERPEWQPKPILMP